MYQFESRIRYSELHEDGLLAVPKIVDYFQDCSIFQSEILGVGIDYLAEKKIAWILSFWQIQILRRPGIGERVTVGTFPYEFKGFLGMRNFLMKDEAGRMLVQANSIWSLLDTERFRPVRPEKEMMAAYTLEERLPMEYAARKLVMEEGGERLAPIQITPDFQDTNHHVNNARYVTIAMDALEMMGEYPQVKELRVEYKGQAHKGDLVYPVMRRTAEGYQMKLENEQGTGLINMHILTAPDGSGS
ncbi:MAG: thioesterase [Lachnospiraceae bacterium]|nr:thioesterase [Lachnospiraceae bacterium]